MHLLVHPNVNEVCVTYRDRDLGEKEVVAIVSSDVEINTMELLKFAKDKLFQYEIPKEIIVTNDPYLEIEWVRFSDML